MERQFKPVDVPVNEAQEYNYNVGCHWVGLLARTLSNERGWHRELQFKYPFHPAALAALKYKPADWQLLVFEWPHKSTEQENMLAFTRSEADGERNRQTRTTIGKYIRRHFPDMPDHELRDLVALHTVQPNSMEIRRTVEELVEAAVKGPHSCMSWDEGSGVDCADGVSRHPYAAYDPSLGWAVAVRLEDGRIDGRAVLHENDERKIFVRSFKRDLHGGYSYSDEQLEAWLQQQGYIKADSWEGCRLKFYRAGSGVLAPYLDGGVRMATDCGNGTLVVDSDGDYDCEVTDGIAYDCDSRETCACCGDYCNTDDMYSVGWHGDHLVCDSCHDEYYTEVSGAQGNMYYVHNDYAVEVNDEWYDSRYLDDNGIITDVDGNYQHENDCVEVGGEWYLEDDERIVECEDSVYRLRERCVETDAGWYGEGDSGLWKCARTDEWYHRSTVQPIEINGETTHPDEVTEEERHEYA